MTADDEARKMLDKEQQTWNMFWNALRRVDLLANVIGVHCAQHRAKVAMLEQRIAAARNHIEQAKLWTDSGDECAVHLRWAEMALDGEEVGA